VGGGERERERERILFAIYITIYEPIATNNGRLPEGKNHHCWPPMINHRQ